MGSFRLDPRGRVTQPFYLRRPRAGARCREQPLVLAVNEVPLEVIMQ
jgi:hypothetical protein